ncbi:MAG: DUF2264 domain-containing protein [Breznakibacter sp.]
MRKALNFILAICLTTGYVGSAQSQSNLPQSQSKAFVINNPDHRLSPITGVTRQHWKDAALYMLEGAFSYIHSLDDPMKFPKQHEITYPRNEGQVPTEKLEGLCRTLFVAAPLLKENPDLVLNGIKVGDYYRHQIGLLIDPQSPGYIKPRAKNGGPSQNLVEFGALSISLFAVPEVIWEPLPQIQKDALASVMISYGDGPTVDSNWKFFNIFVLSFFKEKGYVVNEKLLEEYLQKSLAHYRGQGWYHDSPAYDYYSMWAFQMYGMIWSEMFGNKYYPDYAKKFMDNFNDLKTNYPYMFSADGKMIMWGRSISYRFGTVVPFPLMGFENDPDLNYGWMRRIASGVLMQFMQHPGFMQDNVPTLGFYGPFEPAVQMYSCRGSVYWMGKLFLGLLVPGDSPFWTAIENNGAWETELAKGNVYNKFLDGSKILVTDYPDIGASEVRAWCHEKVATDWQKFRASENYNRLAYNSAFLWQADGPDGEVAMNYVVKNKNDKWEALRLFTFKKFENGVYYRDAVLETNSNVKFNLADIPLPNGILRVDRNISADTVEVRLGHYALPQLDKPVKETFRKIKGHEVRIIDNGIYQLALVALQGWDKTETIHCRGLHPESDQSAVTVASGKFNAYDQRHAVYATLMLWKKSGEKWQKDELFPLKKWSGSAKEGSFSVTFINGDRKQITFD